MVPDRKLMLEVERQMASIQTGPYLDFFLALAICNTVLVSSATAQRQRVRANAGLAGAERVEDMLKNSPHVKTITIIVRHVNYVSCTLSTSLPRDILPLPLHD